MKGRPLDEIQFNQTMIENIAFVEKAITWTRLSLAANDVKRVGSWKYPALHGATQKAQDEEGVASDDEDIYRRLIEEENMDITARGGFRATTLKTKMKKPNDGASSSSTPTDDFVWRPLRSKAKRMRCHSAFADNLSLGMLNPEKRRRNKKDDESPMSTDPTTFSLWHIPTSSTSEA